MRTIGYLGPKGTFTEIAVKKISKDEINHIPYQHLNNLMEDIENNKIKIGVIPIENSIEGGVNITLDLLVKYNLNIINEIIIPIKHSIAVVKKIGLNKIKNVISHPQALAQCKNFLDNNLTDYKIHPANSTAEAMEKIKDLDESFCAIGNKESALYYNLKVLKENVQDEKDNWTRFIIISKEKSKKTNNDKTSIICSAKKDTPGALYDILHEFAIRGINLTRIESRPTKKMLGEYLFFIDFEGHIEDKNVIKAIDIIKYKTSWFKLLGSYPISKIN
jgi:prephenate dehydratase